MVPVPHRDYFSVSIYEGPSPLELHPAAGVSNPVLTGDDVTDVAAHYVADPFMVRHESGWHMFFEILTKEPCKGVIGLASSPDGRSWTYRQVVLEEPFHLSYPHVFEEGGVHYMIPESYKDRSVRLYRATQFPVRWELVGILLENVELVDCTPVRHDGKWWLFAGDGAEPYRADMLKLYHADRLEGPWIAHPMSPLISGDARISRPAGRIVRHGKNLLRFTQDCEPRYGLRVRAFRVLEMSETRYSEIPAADEPILTESHTGWNSSGMHHVDAHQLGEDRWLACVDGWCWSPLKP